MKLIYMAVNGRTATPFLYMYINIFIIKQGFTFPPEAGYALDTQNVARYYLMESLYSNPSEVPTELDTLQYTSGSSRNFDSSGLRLYYTPVLRKHDAGVMSIGK